jgi:iron uptake system component EfeO
MLVVDSRNGVIATLAVTMTLLLTACANGSTGAKSTSVSRISAGLDDCGRGWTSPHGGRQTFELHNTTVAGEEVYLEDVTSEAVYLDVENLGANARQRVTVTLRDGDYRFVCLPADADPAMGDKVTISGTGAVAGATPAVKPVTRNDLIPALKAYESWIQGRLPVLLKQVEQLEVDIDRGDLAAARDSWLTAHRTYETLGAAYDAFGDFDADINGTPVPGETAAHDRRLEGFHRVEAMLFGGSPAADIAPHAARLVHAVSALRTAFLHDRLDPVDIGLRAHEILENALELELTGRTDAGSHSSLATIDANLTGTRAALAPIRSILSTRYRDLAKTERAIDASQQLVRSFRGAGGRWRPLSSLSRSQRERVDAQISGTLELLAPIAAICDPRRSA